MLDITFQQLILRGLTLLVVAGFHGWAVAAIARLLGDRGPGYDGRMTPNPAAHLDWIGSAGFMLFQLGWIRPVRIDPAELRGGRAGLAAVAVLALAATVLFAFVLLLAREPVLRLVTDVAVGSYIAIFIRAVVEGLVWFVAFNVLPLPPLTGGLLLAAVSPAAYAWLLARARWIGAALVIAAAFRLLQPAFAPLRDAILDLLGL